MAALRNLKIKTSSTCRRIVKELHSYEKEVTHMSFVENMLAESRLMIPDCHKRLEDALGDLKGTLVELEESGHKDGLEADDARSILTEVEQLFQYSELKKL